MIYFLRSVKTGYIKCGFTDDYHQRLSTLRNEHGELELLGLMDGDTVKERTLHKRFAKDRIRGREWFKPSDDLREFIHNETHLNIPKRRPTSKSTYVRVSDQSHKALVVIAAKMKIATGDNISADKAIWALIEQAYPDVAERFKEERPRGIT